MSNPTRFLDRESGRLCEEPVYGRGALDFAYGTRLGRALLAALPHHAASNLYARLQRRPSTRARIPGFITQLAIDAAQAEYPVAHYRSLDEFFCRLKPGARPVDPDPRRFVMPADGRTLVIPRINQPHFTIKGSDVHLADLVREEKWNAISDNARVRWTSCYNCPKDCHRDFLSGTAHLFPKMLQQTDLCDGGL